MRLIDSYSEHILYPKHSQDEKVGILPKGIAREDYLTSLDILIREYFTEMTSYNEADFRSGRAILLLVRKYCLSGKCYSNIKKGESLAQYLEATNKMLEDELNRLNTVSDGAVVSIDHDKAFTIIYNAMQILTSVLEALVRQKAEGPGNNQQVVLGIKLPFGVQTQAPVVEMYRKSTSIGDVVSFIDESWDITKNHLKAKESLKFQGDTVVEWTEFKYLKMILEITIMRLYEIGVY